MAHPPPPPPQTGAVAAQVLFSPWEPPPPYAPPPTDPETKKRIDKLVEYVLKNGPQFESLMRDKQRGNPAYAFLLGPPATGSASDPAAHAYYRFTLHQAAFGTGGGGYQQQQSQPLQQYEQQQQQQYQQQFHAQAPPPPQAPPPAVYVQQTPPLHMEPAAPSHYDSTGFRQPPPPQPRLQAPPQQPHQPAHYPAPPPPLPDMHAAAPPDLITDFISILDTLSGSKDSIKSARQFVSSRSTHAPGLARVLRDRAASAHDTQRRVFYVYLVHDIFFNGLAQRPAPHQLDPLAQAFLPVAGELLAAAYNAPTLGGEEDDTRSRLHQILRFWGDQHVFDMETIARLERQMLMGSGADIAPSAGGGYPHPPPHPLQQSGGYPPPVPNYPPPPPASFTPPQPISGFMAAPPSQPPALPSNSGTVYGWDTHQQQQQQMQPQLMLLPQVAPEQQTQHQHVLFPPMPTTAHPSTLLQPEKAETSAAFPPGLLPSLVRAARSKAAPPYSPISPLDIPSTLPSLPSQPDAYLKGRLEQFYKEIDRYNEDRKEDDDGYRRGDSGSGLGSGSGSGYEPSHRGSSLAGLGANYEYEYDAAGREGGGDDFAMDRRSRSKDYHGAYEDRGRGR